LEACSYKELLPKHYSDALIAFFRSTFNSFNNKSLFAQKMHDFGWRLSFILVVIQNKGLMLVENIRKPISNFQTNRISLFELEKSSAKL
jgi:hypothetical protein